jgi:hypothetical protein
MATVLFAPGGAAAARPARARHLLGALPGVAPREDWRTLLHRLTGLDLTLPLHKIVRSLDIELDKRSSHVG